MTDDDLELVRLAATWHPRSGWRETQAQARWGFTGPRFWQRVRVLLADADVEAALPLEVHRLQRQREAGRARRVA